MIYGISRWLARALGWLWFDLEVRGAGNLPREGGVVLACNHQSFADVILIGVALSRPVRYMARRTLWDNRLRGLWMTGAGALPVTREGATRAEIRALIDVVASGGVLAMFPEGTRTPDGSIGEMQGGVALFARRGRAPVVPVLIEGAFEAWPRGRTWPRRGRVTITVGEPVNYPRTWEDREVAADIRRRLLVLRDGPAEAGVASGDPALPPPQPDVDGDEAAGSPRGGGGAA